MSKRNTKGPRVHLHWVRETPSRSLEKPVSTTLATPNSLPPCVRAAVCATNLATVELHLPPYRPVPSSSKEQWLASLRFRQDAVGRLIATSVDDPDPLATMAFHQAIVLAMRAISGDSTPLTIVAEPPPAPVLRQPLAMRHRCKLSGGLANAPAERSQNYYHVYRAVSIALQSAIRESLPAAHVESVSQLADLRHTYSLLTWSAAAPVVGRHVDQLGVDVLNENILSRAILGMPTRLAMRLEEVWEILQRNGASAATLKNYRPSQAVQITKRCTARVGFLHLLFANEFRVIAAFLRFCGKIDGWRAKAKGNPAVVYREVRTAWEDLEIPIRRFYQRHPHSAIGSVLLLEAVKTLEAVDWSVANALRGETVTGPGWRGVHRQ